MHLNKLILHNFKKYRRAEIAFQDGLTGIVGGNGAGKSTIVEAVAWALYGSRASTIKREFLKNSNARDGESVVVQLSMNLGNRELVVYRAMKGRNLTPDASLTIDGRRVASGTKEVDGQLEKVLCISFQDFMKTFYARQKDLDNLLKEGGVGKREYLLKLLGLEEIRESALDQIKEDARNLDDERNRLRGAISEIGDVDSRIEETSRSVSEAMRVLEGAEARVAALAGERELRRKELDLQSERRRSHDLIQATVSRLQASIAEKMEAARRERSFLQEMERNRAALARLRPSLERLREVRTLLDSMEPRRQRFDELSRKMVALKAEIGGKGRILDERERQLVVLRGYLEELETLGGVEEKYGFLVQSLVLLEAERDRHTELQRRLAGASARHDGLVSSISRVRTTLGNLEAAKTRLVELSLLAERHDACQRELAFQIEQRDLSREADRLFAQRGEAVSRRGVITSRLEELEEELEGLGDLDSRAAELRRQDLELDGLGSELGNRLAELRSDLRVQESRNSEARRNLSRVSALGPDSNCPTCERPLGDQRSLLVEKYGSEQAESQKAIVSLRKEIAGFMEKVDSVVRSRTRLKEAFDELNALKGRRSELLASRQGLEDRIAEMAKEADVLEKKIEALGPLSYDSELHLRLEEELDSLAPLQKELVSIKARLEQLPSLEEELDELVAAHRRALEEIDALTGDIAEVGYDEAKYAWQRRRLGELEPHHKRFSLLKARVAEISGLERSAADLRAEVNALERSASDLEKVLDELDFDPEVYEGLVVEKRDLSLEEKEANELRLTLAGEDAARDRLRQALDASADLESELTLQRESLFTLGYEEGQLVAAREALAQNEAALERSRKEAEDLKVRLGVLEGELGRLGQERRRKDEYQARVAALGNRMEVVEATRNLVNRFMDHVLLKVKEDIARTAGSILEEVTGKYSVLHIDDDFNINVESEGELYPITRFSGGEIDMIAVSVRVAISEYLMRFMHDGPGYTFMILDEVFGSQDVEHRENMINMLRRLDDRFPQIFAISHISEVQGQFDNTINVTEDEMGNSTVELS